jgi:hypothetical protein
VFSVTTIIGELTRKMTASLKELSYTEQFLSIEQKTVLQKVCLEIFYKVKEFADFFIQ